MGIDRRIGLEETVGGNQVGEIEIGFVEGADRSDVLPVTFENVGADVAIFDCSRNDVFAEIERDRS
jgi:hypothetical protein